MVKQHKVRSNLRLDHARLGGLAGAGADLSAAGPWLGGLAGARALARVGSQVAIEAVQEGGQQALQNLIAREGYNPEKQIIEGVEHGAGIGGIVGGIAGMTREGVFGIADRRSRICDASPARLARQWQPFAWPLPRSSPRAISGSILPSSISAAGGRGRDDIRSNHVN